MQLLIRLVTVVCRGAGLNDTTASITVMEGL